MSSLPLKADATAAADASRYLVPGLQRGLQLLAQFRQDTPTLTGAELSRRLGVPRASVFRLLQTLEHLGFVERLGDSAQYRLGIAVLRLGFEYLASMELTENGRPVLDDLSNSTGYSGHLAVRDGTEVVFVAKTVGNPTLFSAIQVGARLPVHATVLGRVLLAGQSIEQLRLLYPAKELKKFTNQTPLTVADLKNRVDADAARGFGVSQGGYEVGISTIAAPVWGENAAVCAAISITIPSSSVKPELLDSLVQHVCSAAAKLSQRMGHSPRGPHNPPVAPSTAPVRAAPSSTLKEKVFA